VAKTLIEILHERHDDIAKVWAEAVRREGEHYATTDVPIEDNIGGDGFSCHESSRLLYGRSPVEGG